MNKALIVAMASLVPLAVADEIKLKDGKVYSDCRIDAETPEFVSVQVKVAGGIWENITIKRELIASIEKDSPDEIGAAKLKRNYANVDTLSQASLENVVKDMDAVIKKNPKGLMHDAATDIKGKAVARLDKLKAEAAAIAEAEAKEAAAVTIRTQYDYEANKLLKKFKALKGSKPFDAMAVYVRLKEGYPGTKALKDAQADALKLVEDLDKKLNSRIAAKEKFLKQERAALAKEEEQRRANPDLTREQLKELRDVFRKKQDAVRDRETKLSEEHRDRRVAAREKGDRWFEPVSGCLDSMREIKRLTSSELERMKGDEPETGAGSEALAKAWALCDEEKFEEAWEVYDEVRAAQVPREYRQELETLIREGVRKQKAAAREKAKEEARKKRGLPPLKKDKKEQAAKDAPKPEAKDDKAPVKDAKPAKKAKDTKEAKPAKKDEKTEPAKE